MTGLNRVGRLALLSAVVGMAWAGQALRAQSTPFLSEGEIRMLVNEISGDRAFEHIRVLSRWHRNSGMEGYFKAADYVVEQAKRAGLTDVRFIEQPLRGRSYTPLSAELWMLEPVEVKLADIGDHALYLADGSHDADVQAELVWAGSGTDEASPEVAGKIVLTDGDPGQAVRRYVWGMGAVGVVAYSTSENKSPFDYPDQIGWKRIPMDPPQGQPGTFAFVLPPRKGDTLRRILETEGEQDLFATGKRTPGGRVVLHALVDTEIGEAGQGRSGFVEGWIRGSRYPGQQIVLTAHLQEEQGSANDDGSGCANLLELARTFNKLIREGRIPPPLRDIRFWWTDEISSEYRYFSDHPEETDDFLANLHEDMVGARQSMGSRVQHLIFAPYSRLSYLDALFESLGTFLKQTNNSFLAAGRQGGLPRPHSWAIYSTRGSRDGYNATFVPHFGNSDHITFLDAKIGVPAVALINWDDDFIHSSDDDLQQIDQTQLKRNAFLIGAMAMALAYAEPSDVPVFASETYAQGTRRLGNDLRVAFGQLRRYRDDPSEGWKEARLMIEQGIGRELSALRTVRALAGEDPQALKNVQQMLSRMQERQAGLLGEAAGFYGSLHGGAPGPVRFTEDELAAQAKVPANIESLPDYFARRRRARARTGMHGLMASEVYRFVDGKRSYYDIYKAVRAEALAAGAWYYGEVELGDVADLLDSAVQAGALQLVE